MTTTLKLRRAATAFALALSIGAAAMPAAAQARMSATSSGLGASHDAFCASMADQINTATGYGDQLEMMGQYSNAQSWYQYAYDLQSVAAAGGCRFIGIAGRAQSANESRQPGPAPTDPKPAAKAAMSHTLSAYGLAG
ncbi:MAG: hypothetical protein ACJ76X_10365 [Solirubrobacteraceae bacterium]